MKKLTWLGLALLLFLTLTACSEKDPTDNPILGYLLDQFINADTVRVHVDPAADDTDDFRSLFAYEIVSGEDGFSPRQSVNAGYDIPWDKFSAGYLVPSDDMRTWFPNTDLPGAFRVRDTGLFRLYRKVDVDNGLRGSQTVELRGLSLYPTENWSGNTEDAVKLSDLVQGIAAYDSLGLIAADGYTKYYQPDQVNDGYYLLASEVTTFPTFNATMPGSLKKFKKLATVQVYGATSAQAWDFELAPLETADLTFTVPASFEGYESTELESE